MGLLPLVLHVFTLCNQLVASAWAEWHVFTLNSAVFPCAAALRSSE